MLEKLQLVNTAPALLEPKLSIEMIFLPTEDCKSLQHKKVHEEVPNVVFDIILAFSVYSIRSTCYKNRPVGETACNYSQKSFS